MPSPIAHAAAGYAIYKVVTSHKIGTTFRRIGPLPILLVIIVILSFLPDFDFIPGVIAGDYDAFHNSYSNSLIVGFLLALLIGFMARVSKSARFIVLFLVILAAYELHVLMDYFGAERGVMLFWPLTEERFVAPVKLFYGLHRSQGLWSIHHVWTVLTEGVFAAVVAVLVNFLWRPKASSSKGFVREVVPTDNESAL